MKKVIMCVLAGFCIVDAQAQTDTAALSGIFERLAGELKNFKPDTTDVPQDKMTRLIVEFRNLRGGFNINEAVQYKLEEEQKKNPGNAQNAALAQEFKSGNARRWLDNATIHIYRDEFTYREMKKLVKFYKTSAGQKMAAVLPVNIAKTLMAAEMIQAALKK